MGKELQVISRGGVPVNKTPTSMTQVGDKNTQVAHAEQVIANTTIFLLNSGTTPSVAQDTILAQFQTYLKNRSCEYYNLFVIGGETFANGRFFVPPNRALTESIEPALKSEFAALNDSAKARLLTFPSLFMDEIDRTNPDQTAYHGFVTGIAIQANGIRIAFQKLNPLLQHKLNEIYRVLALEGKLEFNELNRTHWTVKRINLLEELRIADMSVC
jgi:hypothetical protein